MIAVAIHEVINHAGPMRAGQCLSHRGSKVKIYQVTIRSADGRDRPPVFTESRAEARRLVFEDGPATLTQLEVEVSRAGILDLLRTCYGGTSVPAASAEPVAEDGQDGDENGCSDAGEGADELPF